MNIDSLLAGSQIGGRYSKHLRRLTYVLVVVMAMAAWGLTAFIPKAAPSASSLKSPPSAFWDLKRPSRIDIEL